ncbi:MAG: hypothetical protein Q8M51_08690 [Polaromonas sp.]|nr:hypothetical protein [Polaromonas sp.]
MRKPDARPLTLPDGAGACTAPSGGRLGESAGDRTAETNELLASLLNEVRRLRLAVERQNTPASELQGAFLAAVSALLGNREWTCDELIEELMTESTVEAARLQVVLRELGISDARGLGNFLRNLFGVIADGYLLRRHRCTRAGVRRWSVLAAKHPATPITPRRKKRDDTSSPLSRNSNACN